MKQLKKIAAFAAIALLAGISCAKENNIPEDPSVPDRIAAQVTGVDDSLDREELLGTEGGGEEHGERED